ncbi:hemagglutinin/amebocyte aggregation factor-like [Actinia tenebrosa]|uniref:Hemagglutinin/amebocyte aggregation factor-like n=1 Tax=Actinia tenebrosa TaxID=6105 RepID=A0A6P8I803_ACTTE|nr:hemagglutinin/amebocyte aggregation factor-like [Actinia tenebrosa]
MQAKEVRHVLFILFLALYMPGLQACGSSSSRNDWHATINMNCDRGMSISRLNSFHENEYEDRRWAYSCHANSKALIRYNTGEENTHDGKLDFVCPRGGYITRMYSNTYRTLYKDRTFKFTCSREKYWNPPHPKGNCYWTAWKNKYDGDLDFWVPTGYHLAGVESRHYNWAEDRIWKFYVCK